VVAKEKPLATSPIVLVLRSRSLDARNATPVARLKIEIEDDEGRGRLGWIKDLEGGAGRGGAGFDA
jgi:hypothetical protein